MFGQRWKVNRFPMDCRRKKGKKMPKRSDWRSPNKKSLHFSCAQPTNKEVQVEDKFQLKRKNEGKHDSVKRRIFFFVVSPRRIQCESKNWRKKTMAKTKNPSSHFISYFSLIISWNSFASLARALLEKWKIKIVSASSKTKHVPFRLQRQSGVDGKKRNLIKKTYGKSSRSTL